MNRRKRDEGGNIVMAPNPGGLVFDHLPVCLLKDSEGTAVCLLFSVSCHPSMLSGFEISAEYPGAATDRLDAHLGAAVSLFLQGTHADVAALRGRGFEVDVLDRDPAKSDYLQVGLRSDSDRAILFPMGAELFAEENWKLIRVPRGASLEPLQEARVFVTRLPHEPVALTLSPPIRAPGAGPYSGTATETDPLIQRMVDAVDPAHIGC